MRCGSDREEIRVGGGTSSSSWNGCLHPFLAPTLFPGEGQDGIFLVPVASLQSPHLPLRHLGRGDLRLGLDVT